MRIISKKYFIVALLGIIFTGNLKAQFRLSTYIDAGENNISNGFYAKTGTLGAYQFGKTKIEGGGQFDLISTSSNFFTAATLKLSQKFLIKDFQFNIQGIFIYDLFSDLIHESNWGILMNTEGKHFVYKLGTEFRTYHITNNAIDKYSIESNKKLHENWNLMYLLGYNIKPIDNKWNIGISITNIDHFLINQETNPMIYLRGKYMVSSPLILFVESWYKSAGSLNISANYFGFFFRTGLIWKLN